MKKVLLLLVSAMLLGCGNSHRDYSVFEELDYETLSKAKDDSIFLEVYNMVEKDRYRLNNLSENKKKKFASITYGELCKMLSQKAPSYEQVEEEYKRLEEEYRSLPSGMKTIYPSVYEYIMVKKYGKVGEFIISMEQSSK